MYLLLLIDKVYWLHKVLWNCYFLIKLLFESATFSEPLLFNDPYLRTAKQLDSFCRNYFFRRYCFTEQQVLTANLAFTVTISIDHLVINLLIPELLDSNYPEMLHHSENLFIKIREQNISIKQCKKFQFFGCLKIYISVLTFSTESAKERTISDLLFLITIYSPKNDNKHPSKIRN